MCSKELLGCVASGQFRCSIHSNNCADSSLYRVTRVVIAFAEHSLEERSCCRRV